MCDGRCAAALPAPHSPQPPQPPRAELGTVSAANQVALPWRPTL